MFLKVGSVFVLAFVLGTFLKTYNKKVEGTESISKSF
jgi:hypothetical protein